MKSILISDLHLEESRPDITEAFFSFCKERLLNEKASENDNADFESETEAFYILGDFFEVWIGDDYETPFIRSVKKLLKEISAKVKHCYFQHGNRDFLIGETFAKETGFKILDEEHLIDISGQNILLMHGDSLCTMDTEYMQARQLLRSEFFQKEVLGKSVEERLALAEQLRGASKEANSGKSMEIMDVTPEEVVKTLEQHKADILIHGHTHRPAMHDVATAHNPSAKRIVMSDWEDNVRYIEMSESNIELLTYHKE